VILEFSDFDTVLGGWAGQAIPKHVVELNYQTTRTTTVTTENINNHCLHSMADAERYYQICAQPLERLWLTLQGGLGTTTAAISSSTAFHQQQRQQQQQQQQELAQSRVIVVHPDFILNRFWKLAVCRILQDVCGVTRIVFQPVLSVIPQALQFCYCPSSSSSNSANAMMIIHVSAAQIQCMVHSNGYGLDYTYQSISSTTTATTSITQTIPSTTVEEFIQVQRNMVLQENNNSFPPLFIALCKSLEATPMELRKEVISNLIFTGHIVVPQFGYMVSKRLYEFLTDHDEVESTIEEEKKTSGIETSEMVYTNVPVNRKLLRPLAKYVGMLDLEQVAPQNLSFLGASAWAEHSNHIEWTHLS
jgi:hypothetical protein